MNIDKCKNCKHYDNFFYACTLYQKEIYLGEGDFDYSYYSIKEIEPSECEYEEINK